MNAAQWAGVLPDLAMTGDSVSGLVPRASQYHRFPRTRGPGDSRALYIHLEEDC